MKPRVYVETSVISYLAARPSNDVIVLAHQQITQEWWKTKSQDYHLMTSQLVITEAGRGDLDSAARRIELLQSIDLLEQSSEAGALAQALLDRGAMPVVAAADALHVTIATTGGAEFLLTWNCRHINNAHTRGIIERVCIDVGFCSLHDLHARGITGAGTMKNDAILDELYQARDELSKKFNYEVAELSKSIKEQEQKAIQRRVKPQPRRAKPLAAQTP